MSQNITVETRSFVDQDTNVVVAAAPTFGYEYTLTVNLPISSTNTIFATRTYEQSASDVNAYNIDLTIDSSQFDAALHTAPYTFTAAEAGITALGIDSSATTFGQRLLEIVAIKIFGHAKARAAIENDSEFLGQTLVDNFRASLQEAINTDRNLIFGQYVNLDRVQSDANGDEGHNDANAATDFNFDALDLVFPINLRGSILDDASGIFNTGPAVGGELLVDGAYNVPLRLILKGTD